MARAVSNGRQIKLMLDTFAMDNDGHYPNAESAEFYGLPAPESSNDYFQQLSVDWETTARELFWIKDSKVCNRKKPHSEANQTQPLQPGDNHWALVENQNNADNPARPLLFDSPPTASGLEFDPDLWNLKAIVIRIDGSAKPERLNPSNLLLDGDNKQLLTPASKVWGKKPTPVTIAYPAMF